MPKTILIKNAVVYDGSGNPPFTADILIENDKIESIENTISLRADRIIDARGLTLSPGFIDTHTHSEFTMLADSRAEGHLMQGVTTGVSGNCGLSGGPLIAQAKEQREADLVEYDIKERWSTLGEFLGTLDERRISINYATLVGHGNIRAGVMGYQNKPPDSDELRRMKRLVEDAIDDGAIGLSTGLIYPPGVYSNIGELIELTLCGNKYAKTNGTPFIYASHMRSEGGRLIESISEVIEIGRGSSGNVHVSHIKTSGKTNWHKIDSAIELIFSAHKEGINVSADRYPYTAASTDLDSILPSWAFEGGNKQAMERLNEDETLLRMRAEINESHPEKEYWSGVFVSSVDTAKNKWMEGKSIEELSATIGSDNISTLFGILKDEKLRAGGIFHSMSEDNLDRFLKSPFVMLGSDSSARSFDGITRRGKPHPRGFGSLPRFLGGFVRDKKLMSMEDAIHKITQLPARTFGLKKRGLIKEGYYADIVIFDSALISDKATFEDPYQPPVGIKYVIVNGIVSVEDGIPTNSHSGRVLRHGI